MYFKLLLQLIFVLTFQKNISFGFISSKLSIISRKISLNGNLASKIYASVKDTPSNSFTIDEEAMMRTLEEEIMSESGVTLEELINPSKVVNLTRDLKNIANQLSIAASASERTKLQESYNNKEKTLAVEKRAVMRGWLKNLFVIQSVLAGVASLFMVYDAVPGTSLPLPIRVLGFWMWWLFIIPSLRARKPSNWEKDALNIAFIASPVISIILPTFTKDTPLLWWANAATMSICYAYSYFKPPAVPVEYAEGESLLNNSEQGEAPGILLQALKALDYGSGQERGARK